MPQKKCIPLTVDEIKYVNSVMEKARKSRAKELIDMRDKKHRAFTARERREIDSEGGCRQSGRGAEEVALRHGRYVLRR